MTFDRLTHIGCSVGLRGVGPPWQKRIHPEAQVEPENLTTTQTGFTNLVDDLYFDGVQLAHSLQPTLLGTRSPKGVGGVSTAATHVPVQAHVHDLHADNILLLVQYLGPIQKRSLWTASGWRTASLHMTVRG